ncbi:MAG: adenylyltransferase/cytidyltransferase family protein [bacterium]|nr:adenylyltransferase/cytidyltransferase family protein [bacterium]
MKTVLVFGTFDGLHPGHEYFLREAKKRGDRLVVLLARDATVEEVKGHLPVHRELDRRQALEKSSHVDQVRPGSLEDKFAVLDAIRPDVICLGYDQEAFTAELPQELRRRGLKTEIVRLDSFEPEKYKSSKLRA